MSSDDRLAGPTPVGGPWLGRGVVVTLDRAESAAAEHTDPRRHREHFELVGRRAVRVGFVVERRATDPPAPESFRLSLGSYDTTNESLRAKGLLPAGRRAYHLDLYEGLGHATLGMWVDEPPYDEVRARVIAALEQRACGEDPAVGVAPVASPTPGGR